MSSVPVLPVLPVFRYRVEGGPGGVIERRHHRFKPGSEPKNGGLEWKKSDPRVERRYFFWGWGGIKEQHDRLDWVDLGVHEIELIRPFGVIEVSLGPRVVQSCQELSDVVCACFLLLKTSKVPQRFFTMNFPLLGP